MGKYMGRKMRAFEAKRMDILWLKKVLFLEVIGFPFPLVGRTSIIGGMVRKT